MTFAEEKRKRLASLLKYIVELGEVSKDKLIGYFCVEWGLRRQKLEEYIAELEASDLIKTEETTNPSVFEIFDVQIKPTQKAKEKVKELVGSE